MTAEKSSDRRDIGADLDHQEVLPEARDSVALGILAVALVLLVLTPVATRAAPPGRGWYLEPRNWPLVTLALVVIPASAFAVDLVRRAVAATNRGAVLRRALWAYRDMGAALEYSVYFVIYLLGIGYLGFAISTLLFGQVCLWRADLKTGRWALANLAFTATVVLVLRVGMGLWFPFAPVLNLLPSWIANSIGTYL